MKRKGTFIWAAHTRHRHQKIAAKWLKIAGNDWKKLEGIVENSREFSRMFYNGLNWLQISVSGYECPSELFPFASNRSIASGVRSYLSCSAFSTSIREFHIFSLKEAALTSFFKNILYLVSISYSRKR
jgi:hypothetical protein